MKRTVNAILACVILVITHFTGNACTTFCIKDSKHLVLARNFDFSAGGGLVIINKRNLKKFSYPIAPEKRFEWSGVTKAQVIGARSHHPGGVNATRCDASVDFYSDDIDEETWRALSSAAGGEVIKRN